MPSTIPLPKGTTHPSFETGGVEFEGSLIVDANPMPAHSRYQCPPEHAPILATLGLPPEQQHPDLARIVLTQLNRQPL